MAQSVAIKPMAGTSFFGQFHPLTPAKMKRFFGHFQTLFALLTMLSSAPCTAQNAISPLANGSFETGYTRWLATGNQTIASEAPYFASDGRNLVAFNGGNSPPNATLHQNFTTTPGRSYLVEFTVGTLAYNTLQQRLYLTITGNSLLLSQICTVNGAGNGSIRWAPQRFSFVADSITSALNFYDQSTATNGIDLLLDHVRISELETLVGPPVAVPDRFSVPPNGQLQAPAAGVLFNDTHRPVKIMPLGDSITRGTHSTLGAIPGGYRKNLAALLSSSALSFDFVGGRSDNPSPGLDPDHQGNDGFRTDQVISNLPTTLSYAPDIVLLHLGTNDILQNVAVSTAAANLSTLVDQLTPASATNRTLYLATLIPIAEATATRTAAQLNAAVNSYNLSIRSIVQQYATQGRRVRLVEMNNSMILSTGIPSQDFFQAGDGIHPAASGYDQMGEIWCNALKGNSPLAELQAIITSLPSHGSISLAPNGGFTYTPNINFIGEDSFSYRASDGFNFSNDCTVTLLVQYRQLESPLSLILEKNRIRIGMNVTLPGRYFLERSDNLSQWIFHSSIEQTTSGWIEFSDNEAPLGKRFYRVGTSY